MVDVAAIIGFSRIIDGGQCPPQDKLFVDFKIVIQTLITHLLQTVIQEIEQFLQVVPVGKFLLVYRRD
jgi:hypothetical protein